MREFNLVNRVLAAFTFVVAFITYTLTLQPSVPFWDCGEFTAAAVWQQVPHPPGAPLWLIVGKWFHLMPFGDDGWRLNFFSGVATAVTVMLVYLIVVQLISRWNQPKPERPLMSYLPVFGGALIAALAFTWSDTNWFNAVESEVYAAGNLLIAIIIWLMMRWDNEAEKPRHDRYLLVIAYVLGLAIGVHLLALLTVPAIAMVIYFRRYRPNILTFGIMTVITGFAFYFLIYKAPLKYIPALLASNAVIGVILVIGLIALVWWSVRQRKAVVYLSAMSFLLIVLGYTSYTQILVRSNSHPPMNENEPDTFTELVSYLGREQYGNRDWWPRRQETDQYYRQYQDQYGEWYPPVDQNEDGTYVYARVNSSGEWKFLWEYQVVHMYLRYLGWNFIGRVSDIQGAGVAFAGVNKEDRANFIEPTGFSDVFPVMFFGLPLLLGLFGIYYHYRRDWKMAFVFTMLFLFLGIIATLQQNQQQPQPRERDYFYAGSFMVFAMWIGIGAAGLAQTVRESRRRSQQEEGDRDGAKDDGVGVLGVVLGVCLLAVPINMAVGGWQLHDRSGNWVPWDYAYNILQSCEKDAILFTNGDNDTFPLWYLQDVAGVRRDVRVVNLSLGNTLWYVWQLKNERPWNALPVPISFPDEILTVNERDPRALRYEIGPAPTVTLDVPADVMARATRDSVRTPGKMTWTLQGSAMGDGRMLIRVQDKLIRNILENNKWKRPVYFSSTVGGDAWAGLEGFFRAEGMAFRIMPVQQGGGRAMESIEPTIMRQALLTPMGDDEFYREPHYGFKFRNLDNKSVMYLEDHRRIPNMQYRPLFLQYASYELNQLRNPKGALEVLNTLEKRIPPDVFPMGYPFMAQIAQIYKGAGDMGRAKDYAQKTLTAIQALGSEWANNMYARSYNPMLAQGQMYTVLGRYDDAMTAYRQLEQQYPGDPTLRQEIETLRIEKYLSTGDTARARAEINTIIGEYGGNPALAPDVARLRMRLQSLGGPIPAPADNTGAVEDSGSVGANSSGAVAR